MQVEERKRNPFTTSAQGGRALSAMQLPWFTLRPPEGFGVLTMTGRRIGKPRRKCVRAIRRGDRVYIVSIKPNSAWLKNVRANPNVRLRIRGGTFDGVVREVRGTPEEERAREAYCETINRLDVYECRLHRPGRPSRAKIRELHQSWFEHGTPLVVELGE
jgi:deazaflavin-dependent oxidoreductase (nitroreductase family)